LSSNDKLTDKELQLVLNFRLIDDPFFNIFFADSPRDVEYILRIILDKSDLEVLEVQTQKAVENIFGRSVRFDVFATDSQGKLYNIEVQRADEGATPLRARYNSSMLDYHNLQKGTDFKNLPETFVIFITENDVLKEDRLIYHIERVIKESGKNFVDRAHIIYVNGSCKDDSELGKLMQDFFCRQPDQMNHSQLAERANFLKYGKGVENNVSYRDMIREIFKDELEQKAAETAAKTEKKDLLEAARKIMRNLNLTAKQAMDVLEISPELREELLPLI